MNWPCLPQKILITREFHALLLTSLNLTRNSATHAPVASTSKTEDDLWVDRYRPQRYTDLLGDDRVHREVMAWVKEWDWCVFGKSNGKKRAKFEDGGENLDEYCRPREKVYFTLTDRRSTSLTCCFSCFYYPVPLAWERRHFHISSLNRPATRYLRSMPGMTIHYNIILLSLYLF